MKRKKEYREIAESYINKADRLRENEKKRGPIVEIKNLHEKISDLYMKASNIYRKIGDAEKANDTYREAKHFKWPEVRKPSLENTMAISCIGCLVLGLIFVSLKITGASIGAEGTSSILSIIFFVLGVVLAFFYFRKKK